MTADLALRWVVRLAALSLLVQTAELWSLRRLAADDGVWRWAILRRELAVFPRPLRALFDLVLPYRPFCALLVVRAAAAIAILFVPHVALMGLLLASSILIALRWRGSFNGGSDFMTLVVLTGLVAAAVNPVAGLWYIALQAMTSYFLAGVAKLRTASWRSGRALAGFSLTTIYSSPGAATIFVGHPGLARTASWCVIVLEGTFPLALAGPLPCAILVGGALLFHLGNVHVFGLNRFVLAWAATYPALFYCSQYASHPT